MKINLSVKLILNYLLLVILVFSFTTVIILHKLSADSKIQLENNLVTRAQLISEFIPAEIIKQENTALIQPLIIKTKQNTDARITVIAKDGIVLGDSESDPLTMENHRARPEVIDALGGKTGFSSRYSYTLFKTMLYAAVPVKTGNGEIVGVIRLALPLSTVKNLTINILPNLWLGLVVALVLTIILGYISAYFVTQPIREITQITQKAAQGDLLQKISITTNDEIGNLAGSLNKMFQQLQERMDEINQEKNKLTTIMTSMAEGVIACDNEGRVILLNQASENLFSVKAEDCQGKIFLEAIRNNDLDTVIAQVLSSGQPLREEIPILLPVQKTFLIQASPLSHDGKTTGAVLVLHDITELKRLENNRREFISNVSHELKTPLTSIKGFIETLLGGALEDKNNNRRFLAIIQEHANRLGKLIDDILVLSGLESREVGLSSSPVNIKGLIQTTMETLTPQLTKKRITWKLESQDNIPLVIADQDKIKQVLLNLLDNAIKFNKENGIITINVETLPEVLKISISDNGIGIPEKDLLRIFERFYRVDKARSRDLGGTGLGLSIVKHIVEAHHGQVGVESIEEKGSTFWFTLPT
ncbi:MAG: ATP-binding protein [bacterium]|nr:ATP-binding protein [bacterium]